MKLSKRFAVLLLVAPRWPRRLRHAGDAGSTGSARDRLASPLLRRPDAPGVQVRQARHGARLRHDARAGLCRRSDAAPARHSRARPVADRPTCAGAIRIVARTSTADRREVRHGRTERTARDRSASVGKVTFDETRVAHVHTRIDGWIEKVFVDFTGDFVKQGQPMLTIYSPEMLASQQELLLAARARDLMRDNPLASAAEHGEFAVRSGQAASGAVALKRRRDRPGAQDGRADSQHHAVRTRQRFRDRSGRRSRIRRSRRTAISTRSPT